MIWLMVLPEALKNAAPPATALSRKVPGIAEGGGIVLV